MRLTAERCRVIDYDVERYPFPAAVERLLGGSELARLHEWSPRPAHSTGDQDTPAHQLFYKHYRELRELYLEFVGDVIAPHYDEDLCVQRVPTFRVHYPGGVAVREFHRDSDYRHQAGIVNYWLPLTKAYSTNAIWVETAPGAEDFRPIALTPGQLLCFDAVALKHGNRLNDTPVTRVSFDFRVLPRRLYRDTGQVSVSRGTRLSLGDYYLLLTRDGHIHHDEGALP